MLASLEARLPATFKKMVSVSEKAQADAKNKAAEQQRQETAPKPEPPKTYTVAATANPPDGGTVSRSPNYTAYYAGTPVTITASPSAGYTFAGWSGVTAPASNNIIVTVENNLTLTANFQLIPPPPPPAAPPKETAPSPYAAQQTQPHKTSPTVITLRIAGATAGGVGLIGGLVVDGAVKDALDKYRNYGSPGGPKNTDAENFAKVEKLREDMDNNISMRNTLYVLAGLGLASFAVTLFF